MGAGCVSVLADPWSTRMLRVARRAHPELTFEVLTITESDGALPPAVLAAVTRRTNLERRLTAEGSGWVPETDETGGDVEAGETRIFRPR